MDTLFLLTAEFNIPDIELSAANQKYSGVSPATAEAKTNTCKLPAPAYHIGTSQKAKRCVNIRDLVECTDRKREEGRIEWKQVRTGRRKGREHR